MKRVSFKVAKAIKDAGYPFEYDDCNIIDNCDANLDKWKFWSKFINCTYIDVWLWLWREKKRNVTPIPTSPWDGFWSSEGGKYPDPEEAIIAAIEYLVDNDLIK